MQGRHNHEINQSRRQREDGIEAVIPNLSWRYSGGTATNQAIAPGLARLLRVAWLGPDRPEGVARLTLRDLLRLRARWASPVVWHARRNIEMAVGQSTQTVAVEAASSQINYDNAAFAGSVERQSIQELPLNGRFFMQLATLEPGVTVVAGATSVFWRLAN